MHVELSLSDPLPLRGPAEAGDSTVALWAAVTARAPEPSLVLDQHAEIVAVSPPARALLNLDESAVGQPLFDVLRLLDFTAAASPLDDAEMTKIPPLLALTSGRLARGLLRLRHGDATHTLDAVAVPLGAGGTDGSLTFFNTV